MKTIKLFIAVVILAISFTASANTNPERVKLKDDITLTTKISKLLKNKVIEIKEETVVKVYFTINKEDEIVVLSVDSVLENLETYIKNRLNYTKVGLSKHENNQTYLVKVRFLPTH